MRRKTKDLKQDKHMTQYTKSLAKGLALTLGILSFGLASLSACAQTQTNVSTTTDSIPMKGSIYDYSAITNSGDSISFAQYQGKVLLIVNTASKCGLTPQYEALEALHKRYADKGLVIVGFPCDQFANQEPGSDEEIAEFCQLNYGVSFQLMKKIKVNGDDAHPIYQYLKKAGKGWFGDAIKWNFTKFLISRDGTHIERYAPTTKPESMEADILKLLEGK